jgi:hypothetical protein
VRHFFHCVARSSCWYGIQTEKKNAEKGYHAFHSPPPPPQAFYFYLATMSLSLETVSVGIVGLIGLNLAFKAVSHLYKTFLRPAKDLKRLGKWAVVTGATGKAFVMTIVTRESA